LSGLPQTTDPNVLVGTATADDCGVYRLSAETALVQTVDIITPVVDDPYTFGAVAAANAVSDVYAMGARPLYALNVVCFPKGRLPLEVLCEILRGGADKMLEAGAPVIGGHSLADEEPKYGLTVTGIVRPDRILTNAGACPGDALVITKPLGSGLITTAAKNDKAPPEVLERAVLVMTTLNRAAAAVAERFPVNACTDVTGFGLLGHLREVAAGSGVRARVRVGSVPFIDGVEELAPRDLFPGGAYRNQASLGNLVKWPESLPEHRRMMLCDPQTSGGLLLALPEAACAGLLAALAEAGVTAAAIGEVLGSGAGEIEVVA